MAGTSRMNREVHVRFCGGLEVKFLRSTRLLTAMETVKLQANNLGIIHLSDS